MGVDTILWLAAAASEATVVALLVYRRIWRAFLVFFIYSVWILLGSASIFVIRRELPASAYVTAYLISIIVDSCLQFGILVEIGMSILRPVRSSLPRIAPFVVGCLILMVGAAIWPFATVPAALHLSREVGGLMHLQQTFSILRVLVFLALAGFSQLLSIGWRNRELQIATGLGFASLVGLTVALLQTHQKTWAQYGHLSEIVTAGYLCSLVYWMVSFAQREQERREFTPQMQNMLLAMAGAARTARVTLEQTAPGKRGEGRMP